MKKLLLILILCIQSCTASFISVNNKIWNTVKKEYIHFKGINFFGFETSCNVFHGLWRNDYSFYRNLLVDNEFNAVRIPISFELAMNLTTPVNNHCIVSEPSFENKSVKEVLHFIFDDFEEHDILILLDLHNENSMITEYPHKDLDLAWINVLKDFSKKPNLLGIDIKNEPHGSITFSEWENSAIKVVNIIQEQFEPDFLFFIEGTQDHASGWGNSFADITMKSPFLNHRKIVFSPHVYGPSVRGPDSIHQKENYFDQWFGFLLDEFDNAVVISEFGGTFDTKEDIEWHYMLSNYMQTKNMNHNFFLLVFESEFRGYRWIFTR